MSAWESAHCSMFDDRNPRHAPAGWCTRDVVVTLLVYADTDFADSDAALAAVRGGDVGEGCWRAAAERVLGRGARRGVLTASATLACY